MTARPSRGHPATPRSPRPLVRAAEAAWPWLAGALAAVGLIGSAGQYGLVGLLLIYVGSALFAMVMVFAAFAESGVDGVRVVRTGLISALVLVVLLGVIVLFPLAGWFVAAFATATSPLVTSRLPGASPPAPPDPAGAEARADPAEQALVDRIFDRIVSDLGSDQD